MLFDELNQTIEHMLEGNKGILAADESNSTIGKRFLSINLENNEENRRRYRLLLANTPSLEESICGVILFEETFLQTDTNGKSIAEIFANKGILPGIKVDKGLVNFPGSDEKVTAGLDGLEERLEKYKKLGARFAKWRNVYSISKDLPTISAIKTGAENLARYAKTCQYLGIVPIVEPEVLMDGKHSIEQCAQTSEIVLHELFHALFLHEVSLEHMILKPSMVTSGKDHEPFSSDLDVADYTISVFRSHVPAAVPMIAFLSGGQTPVQSTQNLNAINEYSDLPWFLSFSFGRALQEDCLKTWMGRDENSLEAQQILLKRAKLNSLATKGEYSTTNEM